MLGPHRYWITVPLSDTVTAERIREVTGYDPEVDRDRPSSPAFIRVPGRREIITVQEKLKDAGIESSSFICL